MDTTTRRLVTIWAGMALLTLAAIPIGHATDARPLDAGLMLALLATAFVKAALLLNDYLHLKAAPAWNNGLRGAILLLLAIIAGLSLMARLA